MMCAMNFVGNDPCALRRQHQGETIMGLFNPLAATDRQAVLKELRNILEKEQLPLRDAVAKALGRKGWMWSGLGSAREKSVTADIGWAVGSVGAKGSIS